MLVLTDENKNVVTWPYSLNALRAENKNIVLPGKPTEAQLNELNVFTVTAANPPPEDDYTIYKQADAPVWNEGAQKFILGFNADDRDLAQAKAIIKARINVQSRAAFFTDIPYGDSALQFRDNEDRQTLSDLYQFAGQGNDITVILADNSVEVIPAATFKSAMETALTNKSALRIQARQIKDAIDQAQTIAELQAVDLGVYA